jgi:hypothetical protein
MQIWTPEIARYWRNYVPPCRPSRHDLGVCSAALRGLRANLNGARPRILILGSTTEYRDWAFEERAEVTVVDSSPEYHFAIGETRTHHNPYEIVVFCDWREMTMRDEFDLAVGDLVVGNIPREDLPLFVSRVSGALKPGGLFITKSFFGDYFNSAPSAEVIFQALGAESRFVDPFPLVAHELTMLSADSQSGALRFEDMFERVEAAWKRGAVFDEHMERFREFGWDSAMKIEFQVLTRDEWLTAARRNFLLVDARLAPGGELADFPIYVLRRPERSY